MCFLSYPSPISPFSSSGTGGTILCRWATWNTGQIQHRNPPPLHPRAASVTYPAKGLCLVDTPAARRWVWSKLRTSRYSKLEVSVGIDMQNHTISYLNQPMICQSLHPLHRRSSKVSRLKASMVLYPQLISAAEALLVPQTLQIKYTDKTAFELLI